MRITLYGAAGTVTGSAFHLMCNRTNILVDLGIFQGEKGFEDKNHELPPVSIGNLDAVLITHGHLDHCGRLPLLARAGYRGPVFATAPTIDIIEIILRDAVRIQVNDLVRINRKREKNGEPLLEPDYTESDVQMILDLMKPVPYNEYIEITSDVRARFREAGHLLGSASIELTIDEDGKKKKVLFSGDLGRQDMAIIRDPEPFHSADLVFMESTYGDRDHKSLHDTLAEAYEIMVKAISTGGKILVPSFAIGRSQQLLYYMARAVHRGNLPEIPVWLDSPMAIEATRIFVKYPELFDDEAEELVRLGVIKGDLSRMGISESPDESRALNNVTGPCMIIAGAGMCNAGRILHHLRHNLRFPETTVLITGYQAYGSTGRTLVDGTDKVRIFGEEIEVKATVASLGGLSAHGGQSDLLRWFGAVAQTKPVLVLNHGEDKARSVLAEKVREKYGITPLLPAFGETITL